MRIALISLVAAVAFVLHSSCNLINPKEPTPFFLQIDSVQLVPTDVSVHGDVSHKITDVWVYANNNLIGAYELPAKIPILADSGQSLDVLAGIQRNGNVGDRFVYPFYKFKNIPLNWAKGASQKVVPQFTYQPYESMKMYLHESFEFGNAFTPVKNDTALTRVSGAKYGSFCGEMYVDANHDRSENIIVDKIKIPTQKNFWVEIDYKADIAFQVDMLCFTANGVATVEPLGGVYPKSTWNKIYLDLGSMASALKKYEYSLIISAYKPDSVASARVLVDNVKIIGPR